MMMKSAGVWKLRRDVPQLVQLSAMLARGHVVTTAPGNAAILNIKKMDYN